MTRALCSVASIAAYASVPVPVAVVVSAYVPGEQRVGTGRQDVSIARMVG